MNEIMVGGVVVNGFLVLTIGFFISRWMNTTEKNRELDQEEVRRIADEVAERAEKTAKDVADKTAVTSQEIKERIEGNRQFYAQSYSDIKCSIDKLSDHVSSQNGRISEIELDLAKQVESCKIRNNRGGHR